MVQLVRHRQTKESATDRLHLTHRVTPRLHKSEVLLQISGNATRELAYACQRCHVMDPGSRCGGCWKFEPYVLHAVTVHRVTEHFLTRWRSMFRGAVTRSVASDYSK